MPRSEKRQERSGSSEANRLKATNQAQGLFPGEYAKNKAVLQTPELMSGKTTGGDVNFGRGANQIGGTNVSSELANVIFGGIKTVSTVAQGAATLAKVHDKDVQDKMNARLREAEERLNKGLAEDGKSPYDKSHYQSEISGIYADYKGKYWLKDSKNNVDQLSWDAQMKVRPFKYTEAERDAIRERDEILNRDWGDDIDGQVEALKEWSGKWESRLLHLAGQNQELSDKALTLIGGVNVETDNARLGAVDKVIKSRVGDLTMQVDTWLNEIMRTGAVPPPDSTSRAAAFSDWLVSKGVIDPMQDPVYGADVQAKIQERLESHFTKRSPDIDAQINSRRVSVLERDVTEAVTTLDKHASVQSGISNADLMDISNQLFDNVGRVLQIGDMNTDTRMINTLVTARDNFLEAATGNVEENAKVWTENLKASLVDSGVSPDVIKEIVGSVDARDYVLSDRVKERAKVSIEGDAYEHDATSNVTTVFVQEWRTHGERMGGPGGPHLVDFAEDTAIELDGLFFQWAAINADELFNRATAGDWDNATPAEQDRMREPIARGLALLGEGMTPADAVEELSSFSLSDNEKTYVRHALMSARTDPFVAGYINLRSQAQRVMDEGTPDVAAFQRAAENFASSINETNGFDPVPGSGYRFTLTPPTTTQTQALEASKNSLGVRNFLYSNYGKHVSHRPVDDTQIGLTNFLALTNADGTNGNLMWQTLEDQRGTAIGEHHVPFAQAALGMNVSTSLAKDMFAARERLVNSTDPKVRDQALVDLTNLINQARLNNDLPEGGNFKSMDPTSRDAFLGSLDSDERKVWSGVSFGGSVTDFVSALKFSGNAETRDLITREILTINGGGRGLTAQDVYRAFEKYGYTIKQTTTRTAANQVVNQYEVVPTEMKRETIVGSWGSDGVAALNGRETPVSYTIRNNVGITSTGESMNIREHNNRIKSAFGSDAQADLMIGLMDVDLNKIGRGSGTLVAYLKSYKDAEGSPRRRSEIVREIMSLEGAEGRITPSLIHALGAGVADIRLGVSKDDLIRIAIGVDSWDGKGDFSYEFPEYEYEVHAVPNSTTIHYRIGQYNQVLEVPWLNENFRVSSGSSAHAFSEDLIERRRALLDATIKKTNARQRPVVNQPLHTVEPEEEKDDDDIVTVERYYGQGLSGSMYD